ncbi:hypothetical protein SEA_ROSAASANTEWAA_41 [Streptomyces phage RosaAsantewaa]|nr:hypothetical protein SEA_ROSAASANTEWAA_41 [Streptomyces phage RosaAsantewaa]
MAQNSSDTWDKTDRSLSGKRAPDPCPSCTLCGQPMFYMYTLFGMTRMHEGTDEFLCREDL